MRVLQVEDDAATAAAVEQMLTVEGHACDTVGHGEDAIAQAKAGGYDLILLDIMLPDVDGFEVLRQLQEAESRVPVFIQAGLIGRDEKVKGLGLGVEEFLVKPFSSGELFARIESLVKRQRDAESKQDEGGDVSDRRAEPREDSPVRRQSKRTRTLKSGQIVYNFSSCVIDCVIKDLSDTGARLVVPDMFECPPKITLRILHGPTWQCRVRWQSGKSIGVQFIDG